MQGFPELFEDTSEKKESKDETLQEKEKEEDSLQENKGDEPLKEGEIKGEESATSEK